MSKTQLDGLVKEHNNRFKETPEFHIKQRGNSSIEIPSALMASFYQTLFENIKSKVEQLIQQVEAKK